MKMYVLIEGEVLMRLRLSQVSIIRRVTESNLNNTKVIWTWVFWSKKEREMMMI